MIELVGNLEEGIPQGRPKAERPEADSLGYLEAKARVVQKRIYADAEFALCWNLRGRREMCLAECG